MRANRRGRSRPSSLTKSPRASCGPGSPRTNFSHNLRMTPRRYSALPRRSESGTELLAERRKRPSHSASSSVRPTCACFRALRAYRGRRHPAERHPRAGDYLPFVAFHGKRGRDRADVHLAPFGHLEKFGPLRTPPWEDDRLDDLALAQGVAAVAGEKLVQRDRAFPVFLGDELQRRIQRQEHRRGVADGRGRCQAAAERRAVAQLAKSKQPEHLA